MDTNVTAEEVSMTEIEERIEDQKTRTALLQKQLECECPSQDCQVEHES
jgi:hypothetical protein